MNMISWRDLRSKCTVCNKRADFDVEYSNDDLPKEYLQGGTRMIGYCLQHLPEEVLQNRKSMLEAAQQPF